jgi:hypothetical protein
VLAAPAPVEPPVPLAPPLDGQPPSCSSVPFGHAFEKASSGSELHESIAEATQKLRKRVEIADIVPR